MHCHASLFLLVIAFSALGLVRVEGHDASASVVIETRGVGQASGHATAAASRKESAGAEGTTADCDTATGETATSSESAGPPAVDVADGATEDAKIAAIAEEESALAVIDCVEAAKGNITLATVSIIPVISEGDGHLVALILEKAFLNGELVRKEVKDVIKVSLVEAVDDPQTDRFQLARFVRGGLCSSDGRPIDIATILVQIVEEHDCAYVYPILKEAERLAIQNGEEELFISAIHQEPNLVQCIYPLCDVHEPCCYSCNQDAGFCDLCPIDGLCKFKSYGSGITSILKTSTDDRKCACPSS